MTTPSTSRRRPWWLRLMIAILRSSAVICLCLVTALLGCQSRLIYHPRPYPEDVVRHLPAWVQVLNFTTDQGPQTAFWIPPSGTLKRTWVCFAGNAAQALGWLETLDELDHFNTGWLLVDYPGYGACAGSPTPEHLRASADGALAALTSHMGAAPTELGVLAHSLGCAVGLRFASDHAQVGRVILLAPFTDMLAMARRVVGWPLCHLLHHRYDNRARLAELFARSQPPQVKILHGSDDDVIPVTMGRTLASEFPACSYLELPGVGHNDILDAALPQLRTLIQQTP